MECYPIIDCKFKYYDWDKNIRCKPNFISDDELEMLRDAWRQISSSDEFARDVEFLFLKDDYVITGLMSWADELVPGPKYVKDDQGRRLSVLVGLLYNSNSSAKWVFPSKIQLSEVYESFVKDKWESPGQPYFESWPLSMNLKEVELPGKCSEIYRKHIWRPSTSLFDALKNRHGSFLYINMLPIFYKTGDQIDFYYSYRSPFNHRRLIADREDCLL